MDAGDSVASVVSIAAVVMAVVVLALAAVVERMKELEYFRPSKHFPETAEQYEEINVLLGPRRYINGRLLRESGYNKIVLLCHGNASNVAREEWRMAGLRDLGYAVLAFDYSGYGKSSGVPSERQMYKDASIMLALLMQTHEPSEIVVYGRSIGAPVAAYVAGRYGIPTLVLESPLSSMRAVIKSRHGSIPAGLVEALCPEFDTAAHLARFHGAPGKLAQRRRRS
jgi:pimeloyl-ACP methyl ester carboxylesterase